MRLMDFSLEILEARKILSTDRKELSTQNSISSKVNPRKYRKIKKN